jgi:hypothetical protein
MKIVLWVVGVFVVLAIIGGLTGGNKKSNSSASSTPASSPPASSSPPPTSNPPPSTQAPKPANVVWSKGVKHGFHPYCAVNYAQDSIVFYAYWHNTGDQTGTSPNMIPMTNNNLSV